MQGAPESLWGLALLIGAAAFFFATWADSPLAIPLDRRSDVVPLAITAMVTMGIHIGRRVPGVRGNSARQGKFCGWTWTVGFLCLGAIISGVARAGADDETIDLLWAAGSGLVIGLLYMAGKRDVARPDPVQPRCVVRRGFRRRGDSRACPGCT